MDDLHTPGMVKPPPPDAPNLIWHWRFVQDLTRRELAALVGEENQQTIEKWEKRKVPDYTVLVRIAKAMGLDDPLALVHPEDHFRYDFPKAVNHTDGQLPALRELPEIVPWGANKTVGNGAMSNEITRWHFPDPWVRSNIQGEPGNLCVIEARGDLGISDPPRPSDIRPGDKLVVDIDDQRPSPPGYFMVNQDMDAWPLHLSMIPRSSPPTVRVVANNKTHPAEELPLKSIAVIGRVIGRIRFDRLG